MALQSGSDEQRGNEFHNFRDFLDFDNWTGQRSSLPPPSCDWVSSLIDDQTATADMESPVARKRKLPSIESLEQLEEHDTEVDDVKRFARQNHSEIEKRRRDKMNKYIIQLSHMLPMCSTMSHKLDKLTVLRMAVQHIKSLGGTNTSLTESSSKPSFLSDDELKHLILKAADGFVFAVGCDRARILFVSKSVQKVLNYSCAELIGQSLFDYVHPQDISKVKEQFSPCDISPREQLIDSKTGGTNYYWECTSNLLLATDNQPETPSPLDHGAMMPIATELPERPTHLCSGARRSFYCRMKYKGDLSDSSSRQWGNTKPEKDADMEFCHRKRKSDQKSFSVIHCTGYLKSWPRSKMNLSSEQEDFDDNYFLSCLVAVGQVRTIQAPSPSHGLGSVTLNSNPSSFDPNICPHQYLLRITIDGKLTFIDQATTAVLGYLPQELLGTSVYEYYHQDDIVSMAEIHRKVLSTNEKVQTNVYRFRSKSGKFLLVRSRCFSFKNPWTKDVEYIVFSNTVVPFEEVSSSGQGFESVGAFSDTQELNTDIEKEGCSSIQDKSQIRVPGLPGGTRAGAGRIGRQIAEEILEHNKQLVPLQTADSTNLELSTFDSQHGQKRPVTPGMSSVGSASHDITMSSRGILQQPSRKNGINTDVSRISGGQIANQTTLLDNVLEEQALEDIANPGTSDGGDEAAMSIIMSLLEADAGLGGPIDFNDLPWPL